MALLSVINGILDFSKNESGELALDHQDFSLNEIAYDVAILLGSASKDRNVELCMDYHGDAPKHFIGDGPSVRQILMNLVGNSVKFTTEGHVGITVTDDKSEPLPLSIQVSDTGVGIPQAEIGTVFQAFQQADMSANRKFGGTGLGLAIAQQLVQLMGGVIGVTSQQGEGSQFTIRLALSLGQSKPHSTAPSQAVMAELHGKSAVVVDDLDLNRKILKRRLTGWGMTVTDFACARDLLAALDETPKLFEKFDLGILDFNMPGLTGVQLFAELKTRLGNALCPMILYSSSDQTNEVKSLKESGFSAIMVKPERSNTIARNLLDVLTNQQPNRRSTPYSNQPAPLQGVLILIAEDNRTNQIVVKKMLAKTGAILSFCDNGKLAVDSFQNNGADVILMDMSM